MSRLLLLTDRAQLRLGRCLLTTLQECAAAGLTEVVVREHDLDATRRGALIGSLAEIPGLRVISSHTSHPRAASVHLAADQDPLPGPHGRSCHTPEEVRTAAGQGAAFATLSPYAMTRSKPGYGPPVPRGWYAEDYPIPVIALGGIDRTNARAAIDAGADGIAVMGCVMRADDPAAVIGELLEALR